MIQNKTMQYDLESYRTQTLRTTDRDEFVIWQYDLFKDVQQDFEMTFKMQKKIDKMRVVDDDRIWGVRDEYFEFS